MRPSGTQGSAPARFFYEALTFTDFFFVPVGGTMVLTFDVQTDGTEEVTAQVDRRVVTPIDNYIEVDEHNNTLFLVRPSS